MAGFNRVIMMGNLTRDPELRQISSGQSLCRLGLAANRQYRNRQTGDMVQEVCFVDVDVWGPQAESCSQYLAKGRSVLVEGRLKLDSWQDQEGNNRSRHTIVADRVVFMPTSMQSDETLVNSDDERLKSQEDMLKRVQEKAAQASPVESNSETFEAAMKESEKIKAKSKSKKAEFAADEFVPNKGELDIKDEPPFKDDLPF